MGGAADRQYGGGRRLTGGTPARSISRPYDPIDAVVAKFHNRPPRDGIGLRFTRRRREAPACAIHTVLRASGESNMQPRLFGPTNRPVALIGQGTWYLDEATRSTAIGALRRGLDLGMTHIDTAEMYGSGAAEQLIGEAIAGRRDEVFLVSKVLPQNASRSGTRAACERSLKRLRTDRLDCYLLHWRGAHPLQDTLAAFEDLQGQGKILSWGVSNFDVEDLEEVLAIAGAERLACNQVLYHLQERSIEHAVIPWCTQHAVAVTAYSPFGHGRFPSPRDAAGRLLADIASAHRATPRQVALAFLTRLPSLFAIPKASTAEHAEENAAAAQLRLSDPEIASIDAAFPRASRPRALPML
jgi:diketogulonate reductase-like aldo/keto reductase